MDYRDPLIERRFKRVKRTLLVASGKGGVGKSLISALIALLLSRRGLLVGLLDLDLHGPSSTFMLGVKEFPREEENGLAPPEAAGVKVMSIDLFARGKPLPISGTGKREVVKELLALTDWGDLDLLVVDLPPETGDVTLAAIKNIPYNKAALLITVPSRISLQAVKRAAQLLLNLRVPIIGIIENMASLNLGGIEIKPFGQDLCRELAEAMGIPYLGPLHLDPQASQAADSADAKALLETELANSLEEVLCQAKLLS